MNITSRMVIKIFSLKILTDNSPGNYYKQHSLVTTVSISQSAVQFDLSLPYRKKYIS